MRTIKLIEKHVRVNRGYSDGNPIENSLSTKDMTTCYGMGHPGGSFPTVFQQTYIASACRVQDKHLTILSKFVRAMEIFLLYVLVDDGPLRK